jgi:glucosylceramidase
MAQALVGSNLKLFSTPWAAPGWMKTNGMMHGYGMLKGSLGGQYYQTWANYFVR